jgi:hypothetical protein
MTVDNLMIVIIFGGIAVCGAYFRAQYLDWRNRQTAKIIERAKVRLLYRVGPSRLQKMPHSCGTCDLFY